MTKTIAINAGSSSLKWQLYEMPDEVVLAKGLIERIGLKDSVSTVKFDDRSESQTLDIADHVQAVKILLDDLIRFDIIKSYDEITGVGHRVVAGGEYFTAHVGNGVSITAVDGGKSVDTSMGLTPLGGVMMGTRTGDLDPAIIPFVIDREPEMADAECIRHVFNKESGLLGISEKSSDMRDIIAGKNAGDEKCVLAYNLYVDRLRKYIAQYFGVLNGADAIVFTAGIGENSAEVRASVLDGLTWFGIEVDPEKNVFGHVGDITTAESAVKVFVIPTDEELVIARDVERLKTK